MRVVGLLRGVNVGGNNRLKMADLRAVVESLGHTDVDTYLQSGNVVFTATSHTDRLGDEISERLRDTCGIDVRVLTRTGAELAAIVAACPYERDDPTKVVVTFVASADRSTNSFIDALLDLDLTGFAPEGLTLNGREVYLDQPSGQGRSQLTAALAKRDDGASTSRNWRTVLALAEMSAQSDHS